MLTILIIVLLIVLLGGGAWGYRTGSWGAPGGLIGLVFVILILWLLFGGGNLAFR